MDHSRLFSVPNSLPSEQFTVTYEPFGTKVTASHGSDTFTEHNFVEWHSHCIIMEHTHLHMHLDLGFEDSRPS